MFAIDEFKELISYSCSEKEKPALEEIRRYIEESYGVETFKCVLRKNKDEKIFMVSVFLKTNADRIKTESLSEKGAWYPCFPKDGRAIAEIFDKYSTTYDSSMRDGFGVMYQSFEEKALGACYMSSFEDFKHFREKYFDPETMEYIYNTAMFVVYKNKEAMDEAVLRGDTQRMKNDYYEFIKKYDEYGFITPENKLFVDFDYVPKAKSQREYYDLFWSMIREI